jgi:hypothetical protein
VSNNLAKSDDWLEHMLINLLFNFFVKKSKYKINLKRNEIQIYTANIEIIKDGYIKVQKYI